MTIPVHSNVKGNFTSTTDSEKNLKDTIAVFCASSFGKHPAYKAAAISLAHALTAHSHPVVYGGGSAGLMGVVASTTLQADGYVTGIVPYAMALVAPEEELRCAAQEAREKWLSRRAVLTVEFGGKDENYETVYKLAPKHDVVIVDSVHDRKVEIARRASGFVSLPGGFGTYEEILEITSWTQIGVHMKPVVLLNVLSFYTPLRALIQNGVSHGFIAPHYQDLIVFVDGPKSSATDSGEGGSPRHSHVTFDWGQAALHALDVWWARNERTSAPEKCSIEVDWTLSLKS